MPNYEQKLSQERRSEILMDEFVVTFGVQYSTIGHPVDRRITGQSYYVIEASDYNTAHAEAIRLFKGVFSFLYEWEEFVPQIEKYGLSEFKFGYSVVLDAEKRG